MLEKTERARMDNQETYETLNTRHRTWPNKAELQKATALKKGWAQGIPEEYVLS